MISIPFFSQVTTGTGSPEVLHLNEAAWPSSTVLFTGGIRMDGDLSVIRKESSGKNCVQVKG